MASRQKAKQKFPDFIKIRQWLNVLKTYLVALFVVSLDQDFPVSQIQGSWLDGVLPRDAIIALFSFGAATVANLLSWLFSNASKSASKP